MSYDVWLEADLGGPSPERVGNLDANYTSNVGQMFVDATDGMSLSDLDGQPGLTAGRTIRGAIATMASDPTHFRALNPANGWGDYDRFAAWLADVASYCEAAPRAIFRVSW